MGKIIANKNKLANKVLNLRKDLKMTEKEFSKLIGIDINILKNIELGEYDGSVSQLIIKICKVTKTDNAYFKGIIPKKKKVQKSRCEIRPISQPVLNSDIKLTYTLEEISKFKYSGYIFYENIYNTYELKNVSKTRICAFCGKRISTEQIDAEHIVFKCNCNDFLNNCDKSKELERKKRELIQVKLDCHYEDYIKENSLPETEMTKLIYEKEALLLGVKMWGRIPK